jgi:hypothetical protein
MSQAKKVAKDDKITVYGTEKSNAMVTGKAYKVHKELAKKLIAKGHAATEAPKAKTEK